MRTSRETFGPKIEVVNGSHQDEPTWSLSNALRANEEQLTMARIEALPPFYKVDTTVPLEVLDLEKGMDSYNPYSQWVKIYPDDTELTEVWAMRTEARDAHLSHIRFCKEATTEEVDSRPNLYRDIADTTLEAIARLAEIGDQIDLRTAIRDILRTEPKSFRKVYDMNTFELKEFVQGASQEIKSRSAIGLIELDIARLDLEDAAMTTLPNGDLFVSGVYVNWDKDDPTKANGWHTEYYYGTSLSTLEYLGRSEDWDKDHRLGVLTYGQAEDGTTQHNTTQHEMVLAVRPRGKKRTKKNGKTVKVDHQEGKLGYVHLKDIEDLRSPGYDGIPKERWRELDRQNPENAAKVLEEMRYVGDNGVYAGGTWGGIGGLSDIGGGWFLTSLHTASEKYMPIKNGNDIYEIERRKRYVINAALWHVPTNTMYIWGPHFRAEDVPAPAKLPELQLECAEGRVGGIAFASNLAISIDDHDRITGRGPFAIGDTSSYEAEVRSCGRIGALGLQAASIAALAVKARDEKLNTLEQLEEATSEPWLRDRAVRALAAKVLGIELQEPRQLETVS